MAEVIVRRLKLQLAIGIIRLRSPREHITELRIAMGVGLDSPALPGADHLPRFLDMNLQGVIGPEQFPQECIHVDGQLLNQPLECFQAVQLIQSCFSQQIAGEVVAIAELRMERDLAIEQSQLLVHGQSDIGHGGEVCLQHRCGKQPVDRLVCRQPIKLSRSWSMP